MPRIMRASLRIAVVLLGLPLALSAVADAPLWNQLSPDQQRVLDKHAQEFDSMPEQRRQRLADNAARWNSLTPEQKREARARYQGLRELSPEQRQDLRQRWQALAPEQRQRLRRRLAEMTPEQRQAAVARILARRNNRAKE